LPRPGGAKANTRELVASMRIFLQYAQAGYYLKTNQILKNMRRIRHISGTILSGRYDMDTPPVQAYLLSKAWPRAKWVIVESAGHSQGEPDTLAALRRELGRPI
jgi:proline iminopeptidase